MAYPENFKDHEDSSYRMAHTQEEDEDSIYTVSRVLRHEEENKPQTSAPTDLPKPGNETSLPNSSPNDGDKKEEKSLKEQPVSSEPEHTGDLPLEKKKEEEKEITAEKKEEKEIKEDKEKKEEPKVIEINNSSLPPPDEKEKNKETKSTEQTEVKEPVIPSAEEKENPAVNTETIQPAAALPGADAKPTESPVLDGSDPKALLSSLSHVKPTQLAEGMNTSTRLVPVVQEKQSKQEKAALPVIQQPTGLGSVKNAAKVPYKPAVQVSGPDFKASVLSAKPYTPAPVSKTISTKPLIGKDTKVTNPAQINTNMQVDTSMERKQVNLQGVADPIQNNQQKQEADLSLQKQIDENNKRIQNLHVQDKNLSPSIKTEKLVSKQEFSKGKPLDPTDMKQVALTPEMRASMDEQMQEKMNGTFQEQLTKYDTSQQDFESKSTSAKNEGLQKIQTEEESVKQQQLDAQEKGKEEIAGHKDTWKQENAKIKKDYEQKAGGKRKEIDQQIDKEVKAGDQKIETTTLTAENKANKEVETATTTAKGKQQEAENKPKGFWESVGDAVSVALDALKEAVNFIFEKMKAAVKTIIEAAKKAVNDIIDAVRVIAVGLIKAYGEALKIFVNIAFAAFPGVAKWINDKIDKAVTFVVDAVNELASGLKAFANAVLDEIGNFVNMYLTMMQDIYSGIFSALKALVNLNEILDGLANLSKGFLESVIQFPAQMAAEMLGTDMTEPIPNMERTPSEIDKHNKGELPLTTSQNAQPENTLATKKELSDDDTTMEHGTISLGASHFMDLPLIADGKTYELGGSDNPVTTEEMRANVFGVPGAEFSGAQNNNAQETEGQGSGPGQGVDSNTAKWMEMDQAADGDKQKLDWFLDQMGKETSPDPTNAHIQNQEKQGNDSGYPYIAKTNPLSYATRLGFAMKQMGVGLAAWWKQNQTAILLSMLGILVVGGVVAFFTGGAGLLPLAQVLMEVMTYYFMAQAIFMAKGYIKEFFELSWSGKTAEGGKSLAKAFAIIVNEFLMDVILKKVGSVMKKVKESIKATKTFARVSKVANKVIHYAGNLPGIKQLRSIGTKAGKYTIGGINKGMAKASKSLGEFREKVLTAFGFKRVWMERHGNEMQMWGEFNSKVLIMEMEVDAVSGKSAPKYKVVDANSADEILDNVVGSKPKVGEKFKYIDANGSPQDGVLLDVTGNEFTRNMGSSHKDLEDLYHMDDVSRRKKVTSGQKDTRELGKGIETVDGPIPPNFQRHHIISEELAENPAIKEFLIDDLKFNPQNGARNGVALPKDQSVLDDAIQNHNYPTSTPTFHNGSHKFDVYDKPIRDRLLELKEELRILRESGIPDLKAKQMINNNLNNYLVQIKQGLKNGTVKLN
ncbi:MAG TPA: AHH domain-containing protein [Cytophagaceae bacterium]|nr:AHH domain-containing protein [Cytophagaceae bacterium]